MTSLEHVSHKLPGATLVDELGEEAFENAPLMMGVVELSATDDDLLHIRDNAAACAFFNTPPGGTAGKTSRELGASPETVRRWVSQYRASAASSAPIKFEHTYDGTVGTETLRVQVRPVSQAPSGRARFLYVAENITQEKRAEARTRAVLESISDAFFSLDTSWRFSYLNAEAQRLLGEDLVGRRIDDAFPGFAGSDFDAAYRRAMATGARQIVRARYPDHQRTYEARAYPVREGLSVYFRDVTELVSTESERMRLLAELAASEERYRTTFHAAPVGVAHVAPDGRWLRFNDWICTFTGYTRDELETCTFADITHPDDIERDWADARRLLAGVAHSYDIEKRYLRKDGTVVWAALSVSLVRSERGEPHYFISIVQDIDARKRAELELEKTRSELHAIMMGMSEGLIVASAEGSILRMNETALLSLGYGEITARTKTLPELADAWELQSPSGEPLPLEEWPISRVLRGESLSGHVVQVRRRDNGRELVLSFNGRTIRGDGCSPLGVVTFRDVTALTRMERELREREQELRTIADTAPDIIARLDPAHRHVFVNAALERTTGLNPSAYLGKTNQELGMPAHLCELWDAEIERAFTTGEEGRIEFEFHGPRGTRQFVSRILPERGPAGKFECVLTVAHDVTEQKAAEAALVAANRQKDAYLQASAQREAWLEAIVDGSPIGVAVFDRELRFMRVNPALAAINGLPIEAHLGRTFSDVLPVAAGVLEEQYRKVVATGRPVVDLSVSALWQQQRHYSIVSIYPIKVSGTVQGVVGIVQSVTNREREDRRRELLARAGSVLVTAREVEQITRAVTDLLVPQYADFAALTLRSESVGFALASITAMDPTVEDRVRRVFARVDLQRGDRALLDKPLRQGEHAYWAGSSSMPVSSQAEPLGAASALRDCAMLELPLVSYGSIVGALTVGRCSEEPLDLGIVVALQEIAERAASAIELARLFCMAQAERRRADEANRAKDEFLAVVSHELRTPLNGILGWARMLLSGMTSPEKTPKALQTIERNARAQAQLIEDLLDYSRITTGKLRLELEQVDVSRIIEAAVDVVAPAADAKGVTVAATLDKTIGMVTGDPTRLQQAVWNLLTNAVKFTPRGGSVEVSLSREQDMWNFAVTDNGAGISPEFLPFVFDRFRQAEMGAKRQYGGLGLGLSIVRYVVELHGGAVEARSDGIGKGATFRFTIPQAPAVASSPPAIARPVTQGEHGQLAKLSAELSGLRVLVVDDEADAREVVAAMLQAMGAEVTLAADADEALARLAADTFDLIVSDIGMPRTDGLELIERVRALSPERGGRNPAIALTAYARSEDRTRALLAGFDAHVPKPVEPAELMAVIASTCRRV